MNLDDVATNLAGRDMQMAHRTITRLGVLVFVALMTLGAHGARAQETPKQIHDELRALKDRAVDAVNKLNRDALLRELAPNITFTGMSNDVVHGRDKLQAYYDQMLASPSRFIREMTLKVEADDLSQLYANNQIAVASGKADAHFKLMAGREFDWPLRWTATLTRNDGKWSIVAVHFSANAVDNPLLTATGKFARWIVAGAALAGLMIGFLIGWWRRRAASAG